MNSSVLATESSKDGPLLGGPSSLLRLNLCVYWVRGGKDPEEWWEGTYLSRPTQNQHLVQMVSAGSPSLKKAIPVSISLWKRGLHASNSSPLNLPEQILRLNTQEALKARGFTASLVYAATMHVSWEVLTSADIPHVLATVCMQTPRQTNQAKITVTKACWVRPAGAPEGW